MLISLHVAVGPSKIRRAGATVLYAKMGGATGPYLPLVNDMPLAKLPRRPRTSCFVPGEFWGPGRHASKSDITSKFIEQDTKQGASSQFEEWAGDGLQAVPQQHDLRVHVRRCAWGNFLSFFVARVFSILPSLRSATRRSASKCNAGSWKSGALPLIFIPDSVHGIANLHQVYVHAV